MIKSLTRVLNFPSFRKLAVWFLIAAVVLIHLSLFVFTIPDNDYVNVMHVINYLRYPEFFGAAALTNQLTRFHTITAPLYYYLLAYPLSFVVSARWVLYIIGVGISLLSGYFAGGYGSSWKSLLTALLIVILLLHHHVSPVEGNRRSFTGMFLLGILWLGSNPSYVGRLIMTALSAGIYAPVGLILLGYSIAQEWIVYPLGNFDDSNLKKSFLNSLGLVLAFGLVLSGYISDKLEGYFNENSVFYATELGYPSLLDGNFGETFLYGGNISLFKYFPFWDLTVLLGILLVFQFLLLSRKFTVDSRFSVLLGVVMVFWLLAHLLHPYLYQPVRYTRVSLPLILALIFADNLPESARFFHDRMNHTAKGCWLLSILAAGGIMGWIGYEIGLFRFTHSLKVTRLSPKFIFALPLFLLLLTVLPGVTNSFEFSGLVAGISLFLLVFLPHCLSNCGRYGESGHTLNYYSGMMEFINSTPPETLIAGPPHLMNPIPAFAQRPVYVNAEQQTLDINCKRLRKVSRIYYSGSPDELRVFLKAEGIDFLVVDRSLFNRRKFETCDSGFRGNSPFFLDRDFQDTFWEKDGRFQLIGLRHLETGSGAR